MTDNTGESDAPFGRRLVRVVVSITVLTGVTVIFGYGGWVVLTVSAILGGPDPRTDDGERLRHRLADWPDRNRDVMRSNGHTPLPLKP